jgi:hypothetical protein
VWSLGAPEEIVQDDRVLLGTGVVWAAIVGLSAVVA